jgi:hypothetical protein
MPVTYTREQAIAHFLDAIVEQLNDNDLFVRQVVMNGYVGLNQQSNADLAKNMSGLMNDKITITG